MRSIDRDSGNSDEINNLKRLSNSPQAMLIKQSEFGLQEPDVDQSMPNLRRLINQDYDSQSHMSHGPRSTVRSSHAGQFIKSVPRLLIPSGRRSLLASQSDFNDIDRGS